MAGLDCIIDQSYDFIFFNVGWQVRPVDLLEVATAGPTCFHTVMSSDIFESDDESQTLSLIHCSPTYLVFLEY